MFVQSNTRNARTAARIPKDLLRAQRHGTAQPLLKLNETRVVVCGAAALGPS